MIRQMPRRNNIASFLIVIAAVPTLPPNTNTGRSLIERSVVHYGTDLKNRSRRAESPNRWNQIYRS